MAMPVPIAAPAAFQSQKASYVALSALCTLTFALFASIWESDVSGSMAVVGLFAIYMASSELLLVYAVFSPASVIVDIIRLAVRHKHVGGWLIFFVVCEMVAKLAGGFLAYGVYQSASAGEGVYQPVSSSEHAPAAQGQGRGYVGGGYAPPAAAPYQAIPSSQPATIHL